MDSNIGEDKAGLQPTEAERPTSNDIKIDDQIVNIKFGIIAPSDQNQPTTEGNT
jgi:hypothetical protein